MNSSVIILCVMLIISIILIIYIRNNYTDLLSRKKFPFKGYPSCETNGNPYAAYSFLCCTIIFLFFVLFIVGNPDKNIEKLLYFEIVFIFCAIYTVYSVFRHVRIKTACQKDEEMYKLSI